MIGSSPFCNLTAKDCSINGLTTKRVKILLEEPNFGVVLMAKSESDDVVGFCAFTYEYCDKQNATYFQMQGLHVAAQPDCALEATII